MVKTNYRLLTLSVLAFASLLVITSCSKKSNDTPTTPAAGIMAFNLAPDKSAVGFSLSGTSFTGSALGYAKYTGSYLSVPIGDKTLGAYDFGASASPFASTLISLKENKFYSVFLVGKGAFYKTLVAEDDISSLSATSGLAYVRYVNAIVDSVSSFNITVKDNANNVKIDESAIFPSVGDFVGINPGTVNVVVTNSNSLNLTKSFVTEPKKVYTILLSGLQNSATTPAVINYITNGTLN